MDGRQGRRGLVETIPLAAERLWRVRWMLAGGIIAILAVYRFSAEFPLTVALAILGLVGVAAFAPTRPADEREGDEEVPSSEGDTGNRLTAKALAAAITDPLIIFDSTGSVVDANEAAIAAFGALDPGISLLVKFRAPDMQQTIRSVLSGASASAEMDYSERLPVERVFRVRTTAVNGQGGLFVVAFRDQSEARRIDRMRADFIANASHELRTPLASIAGFVETLRGPARNDAAARERFLGIMQNQTARMARLIDDLLSLSRLEMKPYLKPGGRVDLRQLLANVIASLAPLAKESGVEIEAAIPGEPLEVPGDRDELFQVFENLLENACKYGQSGGRVVLSVARRGAGRASEVEVTVRDFGPGISAEHIPRITERFYRIDVESSRAQKGTGLGLSIVKHILTRHNARLSIRSEVGHGAAFTVHLPAR